jgi:phosphatidate cytidylyltransferase
VLSTAVVVLAAVSIALSEIYASMAERGLRSYFPFWYIFAGALVGAGLRAPMDGALLLPILVLGTIASLVLAVFRAKTDDSLSAWALALASVCYVPLLLTHLTMLRAVETPLTGGLLSALVSPGFAWIVFTLATTWLGDTFAYFTGRRFGKTPLAPALSPKKTWEGSIGGFLGAVLTALGCSALFGLPLTVPMVIAFGALAGILGPIGDLAESYIKRQLGIKDASSLLPGHGGMLDRIDSVLFMVPVMYYLIQYLY